MRMKIRRAATKEYLRAAKRIANEIKKSCHSTWTLAHVSRPVNAIANKLSGSGFSRSPHLIFNIGRPSFPKSLPPLDPLFSSSSSLSLSLGGSLLNPLLLLLLFSANTTTGNLGGFRGILGWVCGESESGLVVEGIGIGFGGCDCEIHVSPNMSLLIQTEMGIGVQTPKG